MWCQVGIGFLGGTVVFQVGLCTPLRIMDTKKPWACFCYLRIVARKKTKHKGNTVSKRNWVLRVSSFNELCYWYKIQFIAFRTENEKIKTKFVSLHHCPVFLFYTPCKHQKKLMLLGGIKRTMSSNGLTLVYNSQTHRCI